MAQNAAELVRSPDVPDKIGKYVIINKVGKGSTGNVYLSHDPYYRRDVAIKVYNIEEDADADRARVSRKMFLRILPVAFRGISLTILTASGIHHFATLPS